MTPMSWIIYSRARSAAHCPPIRQLAEGLLPGVICRIGLELYLLLA